MKRPHHRGYVRGGPGDEADLLGCGHCSGAIEVKGDGQKAAVDFCRVCMRFVCRSCEAKRLVDGCVTWESMIDRMEKSVNERSRLRREMGLDKT